MEFNINNYCGKFAMHCKTVREAIEFCNYMHDNGRTWFNGESYSLLCMWGYFRENTVYIFNKGFIDEICNCRNKGYKILEWSDFKKEFTKANLRDGMVVEYANGNRAIVLGDKIVENGGFFRIVDFTNELEMPDNPKYTINKVYKTKAPTIGDLFNATYLTLVWERTEKLIDFKIFKKSDLKDGMVVETANGNRHLVLGDNFINEMGFLIISDYNDDLKIDSEAYKWNINKIYKSAAYNTDDIFKDKYLTLIWERKENSSPR